MRINYLDQLFRKNEKKEDRQDHIHLQAHAVDHLYSRQVARASRVSSFF